MCGIFAVFGYVPTGNCKHELRQLALKRSSLLRHRGPDWNGVRIVNGCNALAHERLSIIDLDNGSQPLVSPDGNITLSVNGEIYNHDSIRKMTTGDYEYQTGSDCEVVIPLYMQKKYDFFNSLDGMFAFVLYDEKEDEYIVARDPIGICSLYQGWAKDGSRWFASEMKSLTDHCEKIEIFPPGSFFSSKVGMQRYYSPDWVRGVYPDAKVDYTKLRMAFEKAVVKRLMSDVPYGVLLSGGLDSSLVASIAARHAKMRVETNEQEEAWWPRLHSFAIGLVGAPDLKAAASVAKHIGTVHHEMHFTVQDGLDALRDVVWHLETYDVTTIRASTPMYLLSRKIKAMGVKMVLSGEGADEILGGYLYFHKAPSAKEFHEETCARVKNLHYADCLRANKSTMAWGLEARVPFLDKEFIETAMSFDPSMKMHTTEDGEKRIEKYIMRKAFDVPEDPYLPSEVLWRQKEQFSDGVGYSWIDMLKEHAQGRVSDAQMKSASIKFPEDTPKTKEAYFYRTIFEELFPSKAAASTVVNWIPKSEWGCNPDPSGRAQDVHTQAY
eukprot:Nk52_evm4s710 gene=Nk52_evmTU4s710